VRFPASVAPPNAIDTCLDKGRFAAFLERLGVPCPRTVHLGVGDDVAERARAMGDAFAKPCDSLRFRTKHGVKAFRIADVPDAAATIRAAQADGLDLLVQEFIPGPPTAHHMLDGFVDRLGRVCAWFARRRVRTYPEPFGDSSCMKTIPIEDARESKAVLERVFQALCYRGVFSAEFKYDGRDGMFKLIEINTRMWGGVSLAVACGVNVVAMAYRDALALDVPGVDSYPAGRHWVYGTRDAGACWGLLRRGQGAPIEWIREWTGAVRPVFRWNDPLPALDEIRRLL
jgi:predicted ATP-grasp superfamily ATP-dependent carboligase